MTRKKTAGLKGLRLDPKNPNKHTEHGMRLLEKSMRTLGAGRGVLASADGVVIAGNATVETAADLGIEAEIVETDGDKLVVIQREDLESTDPRALAMRLADNRTAEVNLAWDRDVLQEARAAKLLDPYFEEYEKDVLLGYEAQSEPTRTAVAETVVGQVTEGISEDAVPHRAESVPKLTLVFPDSATRESICDALSLSKEDTIWDGPSLNRSLEGRAK